MIGKLSKPVLDAILETLPVEWSVVDADDKVLAWNRHETRVFKRPVAAVGREVRKCHPPKSLAAVEKIISEMKAGTRDKARFWIRTTMKGKIKESVLLIEYYALRDEKGRYLGCLETGQDITDIQKLKGEQRLLK
jgi:PAS domain S-box-containing protein